MRMGSRPLSMGFCRTISGIMDAISIETLMGLYHPLQEASDDELIEIIDRIVCSRDG